MGLLLAAAVGLAASLPGVARAQGQSFQSIQNGRYLAAVGDCVACHTEVGGTPYAGGRAIQTPFGAVITPNITPDLASGIGAWTDSQFIRAMRKGVAANGAHLYPAFPYNYYTRVSDRDLRDLRAFLNTLQPVHNVVQRDRLAFPFNIRATLALWNALYLDDRRFAPDPHQSAQWNRGAYLVNGLGHCAACHTAKTMLGGNVSKTLQGGRLQNWFAPDITGNAYTGVGSWSVAELVAYLKTGRNAHDAASGPMAEEVAYSTQHWTDSDLTAAAVYLKSLPGARAASPSALASSDPAVQRGKAIYQDSCSACHTPDGAGIPKLFPQLANSPAIRAQDPTGMIRVVLVGAQAVATGAAPTGPAMPAFGWRLSDADVAAVLTYVRNSWGNAAPAVGASRVGAIRRDLARTGGQ